MPIDSENINALVEAFGPAPDSTSFDDIVDSRLGERPVTDVYGIGPASAASLEKNGITKAWQLLGPVLYMPKDDIKAFLTDKETAGVAPGKVRECVLSLIMNFKKYVLLREWRAAVVSASRQSYTACTAARADGSDARVFLFLPRHTHYRHNVRAPPHPPRHTHTRHTHTRPCAPLRSLLRLSPSPARALTRALTHTRAAARACRPTREKAAPARLPRGRTHVRQNTTRRAQELSSLRPCHACAVPAHALCVSCAARARNAGGHRRCSCA